MKSDASCTQLVERFSNDLIGVPLTIVSPKQPVPTFRQFRLRTTLVVPFVLQIVAAVGLVGYLSFRSSQKAVNDLATQLRRELTARIEGELRRYLASPHDFNRLNGAAFSEGSFDMVNASNAKQFLTQVQISPFVYSSYCGDDRGHYLGAYRLSYQGSSTIAMSVSNAKTNYDFYFYAMDSRGNRRDLLQKLKPYDPRKRPWYIAAAKAKRSIWSEVYLDFASGLPTITASEPVYDSTGKILGVCATDVVLLEDLRKFLASLPIGKTGQAFIIDRSGSMISSSTKEPLTVGKGEDSKLVVATESSEPLIKTTARYLQQQFGSLNKIQRSQQLDYLFEGKRQFVQVLPLNDGRGIDWLITVVVPESDYMGQIYANTRNTFLLTLAALVLAIVIGILTARRLTRPIMQIAQASQDMAAGNLDQNVESSRIIELEELANSFNTMAGQLQESFGALRQSEATNRAIVTAIPDLLIRAKGDGSYLEIARLDSTATKSVQQVIAGRSMYSTLPPELAQVRLNAIQEALKTGEMQVYEHQLMIDNQPRDEEVRIVVIQEDEVLIIVRDITARNQAEAALRQAEENYRGIFENALEGIFQSSPDGCLLKANPAMARIFGYDSPEDIVASITDLRTQLYVDSIQRDEFRRMMQEQGQVKNFEFQAYRQDGSMIWAEMDARAVKDSMGQVLYYEGIVQDISDRKHHKEILEAMVKQRTAQLEEVNAEIAVLNERLKAENLRMGAELDVARQIQQMILPKPEELEIEGLDIAGYMEPADEVGGDYYDVLHTDDIVTIGIGDVTGHGLESGILMLMVQTAVRTLQEVRERDPVRFLDTLNRTIYKNVQRMNSERNLTLAVLNYAEGAVSISGQHEETIVVRKGGQIERIDTMDLGFPIGIDDNIADFISHAIVELQPGDGVVVYTDGIPEAKNIDKKQYGIEPLCEVISHHWHKSASEIKEAIITDLRQFIGKQKVFDDITLLVFKRQDGASEDKYNHDAIASSDEPVHSARESMPVVSTIATGEQELTYDKTQEIL